MFQQDNAGLASPAEVRALLAFPLGPLGFDLETSSLDVRTGKVRLLAISDGVTSLVLDCFEHPPEQLRPELVGHTLCCHHSLFDLPWLVALGFRNFPDIYDTYLLSLLLDGSGQPAGHHSLAGCCKRWLGMELDKTLQTANWSCELTAEQVEYSRQDAAVLPRLLERMRQECERRGLRVLKLTWGK